MKTSRSGQGLSINTLIIAALGILVLIIGVVIYSGTVDDASDTARNCENQAGRCLESCGDDQQESFLASCPDDQVCCIG